MPGFVLSISSNLNSFNPMIVHPASVLIRIEFPLFWSANSCYFNRPRLLHYCGSPGPSPAYPNLSYNMVTKAAQQGSHQNPAFFRTDPCSGLPHCYMLNVDPSQQPCEENTFRPGLDVNLDSSCLTLKSMFLTTTYR